MKVEIHTPRWRIAGQDPIQLDQVKSVKALRVENGDTILSFTFLDGTPDSTINLYDVEVSIRS